MNPNQNTTTIENAGNPMQDSDEEQGTISQQNNQTNIPFDKTLTQFNGVRSNSQMINEPSQAIKQSNSIKMVESQITKGTTQVSDNSHVPTQSVQELQPQLLQQYQTIDCDNIQNPLISTVNPNLKQESNYFPHTPKPIVDVSSTNPLETNHNNTTTFQTPIISQENNNSKTPFSNYSNQFSTPTPQPQSSQYKPPSLNQKDNDDSKINLTNPLLNSPQYRIPQLQDKHHPVEQFVVQFPVFQSSAPKEANESDGFLITDDQTKCLIIGTSVALFFFYVLM